jgi:hypothetical protein
MVTGSDRDAVLACFARRKDVGRHRATAHDEKKLALLQESGYSQEEILAAIDLAFDSLSSDAPPIRMFSYCATVALATPPRGLSPAKSDENTNQASSCHGHLAVLLFTCSASSLPMFRVRGWLFGAIYPIQGFLQSCTSPRFDIHSVRS